MPEKVFTPEQIVAKLREIEVALAHGAPSTGIVEELLAVDLAVTNVVHADLFHLGSAATFHRRINYHAAAEPVSGDRRIADAAAMDGFKLFLKFAAFFKNRIEAFRIAHFTGLHALHVYFHERLSHIWGRFSFRVEPQKAMETKNSCGLGRLRPRRKQRLKVQRKSTRVTS